MDDIYQDLYALKITYGIKRRFRPDRPPDKQNLLSWTESFKIKAEIHFFLSFDLNAAIKNKSENPVMLKLIQYPDAQTNP